MLVALSFHPGDQDQALRLFQWAEEMGGCKGHSLLLLQDPTSDSQYKTDIAATAQRIFDSVEVLDVPDHFRAWPDSANHAFATAARHIEYSAKPQPWLWLEPDTVPLRPDWLDVLWNEYITARKPFLGDYVDVKIPGKNIPIHCSGVAIYPGRMTKYAGHALIAGDVAFDIVAAGQILPQLHTSKHLLHAWKHPAFTSWDEVEKQIFAFKPECVLFHADKSGSLYPLLRARMNLSGDTGATNKASAPIGSVPQCSGVVGDPFVEGSSSAPPAQNNLSGGGVTAGKHGAALTDVVAPTGGTMAEGGSGANYPVGNTEQPSSTRRESGHNVNGPAQFISDLFLKTYGADHEWASYCLRSIDKFCRGFRRVVVISPDPFTPPAMQHVPVEVLTLPEPIQDGYLGQQLYKLAAHQFSDADYICHIDSDCVFVQVVTPETYLELHEDKVVENGPNGFFHSIFTVRPAWLHTPYSTGLTVPWREPTEKFMGEPVEFEFMRRQPFMLPRWAYAELESFCQRTHGCHIGDYIARQPLRAFSEYNAMGAFLYRFHYDKFHWINTAEAPESEWPLLTVDQRWSWGGLTDEVRAHFEQILAAPTTPFMDELMAAHRDGKLDEIIADSDREFAAGVALDTLGAEQPIAEPVRPVERVEPWKSKGESLEYIRSLAMELRAFCGAPRLTAQVREILREERVIK